VKATSAGSESRKTGKSLRPLIVTINYQLGPFGLKDQQRAITWTHDKVHLFGGDPHKKSIFGQSAGFPSVVFKIL
jgi:carboxylesterase type B